MFPLDLHHDLSYTLTHHEWFNLHWRSNPTHLSDMTSSALGSLMVDRTAEGVITSPLSSTGKEDKVTIGKVGFCGKPYGEGGRRRREPLWRGMILG